MREQKLAGKSRWAEQETAEYASIEDVRKRRSVTQYMMVGFGVFSFIINTFIFYSLIKEVMVEKDSGLIPWLLLGIASIVPALLLMRYLVRRLEWCDYCLSYVGRETNLTKIWYKYISILAVIYLFIISPLLLKFISTN